MLFLPIHFFVRIVNNSLSCSDSVVLPMSVAATLQLQVQAFVAPVIQQAADSVCH